MDYADSEAEEEAAAASVGGEAAIEQHQVFDTAADAPAVEQPGADEPAEEEAAAQVAS